MYKKMVVIALGLMLLVGCNSINQKQADQIIQHLEVKYNEKFTATHIGGRYGTKTNDTVTTVNHPEGNEYSTFYAKMTKDGEFIGDGYIRRLISDQFNQLLKEELEAIGIEGEFFTFAMKSNSIEEIDTSITIDEYVDKYEPGHFSAHGIIKDTGDVTGEDLEKALHAAYEEGKETIYQVQARVMPEEEYEKARDEFRKLPRVSGSWFSDYDVVEKIDAIVDPNGFNFRYAGGHSAYE